MNQVDHEEAAQIDIFVKQLKDIFTRIPVAGNTDPADREAVREIGKRIYESDLPRGMKKVAEKFAQEMPLHARRLDMLWDGVGSWMG